MLSFEKIGVLVDWNRFFLVKWVLLWGYVHGDGVLFKILSDLRAW